MRPHRHEGWLALGDIPGFGGLRTARHTYVEYDTGERELYDLTTDPAELRNVVAETDPAQLARFHRELLALDGCAGAGCRRAENATPDP